MFSKLGDSPSVCKMSVRCPTVRKSHWTEFTQIADRLAMNVCARVHSHIKNFDSNKFDDCNDHFQNISITMKIYAILDGFCEISNKWARSKTCHGISLLRTFIKYCYGWIGGHTHINRRRNSMNSLIIRIRNNWLAQHTHTHLLTSMQCKRMNIGIESENFQCTFQMVILLLISRTQ